MTDFLLELRSEEIPARMQAKAREDLARLFATELGKAGLKAAALVTYATPRRLALIARDLPLETAAVSEETKGPRSSAPPQALEGFLRKTGLTQGQLEDRDGVWFAVVDKPGRKTADVLAEVIPAMVRQFPWPKSMRWGDASASAESLRWVRPLQGIVALLGEGVVPFEIAGIASGSATLGHRFHHPGAITIGSAADYVEKLRACHVIVDQDERATIIRDAASKLAADARLELIEDEGLVAENAGLTEWPVPLLGRFDEAFLDVPPEVIQLTARVNQKYFVCREPAPLPGREGPGVGPEAQDRSSKAQPTPSPSLSGRGGLANAFICTANIAAADGGAKIVEGNRKVLAARLADAKFFYDTDLKMPLDAQAQKLGQIVFHEKLGTVADKVDRVAKLARWLVEEGIIPSSPARGGGARSATEGYAPHDSGTPLHHQPAADGPPPLPGEDRERLAALAERAARLAKADLVTGMVGEFPELQGLMGGYYAAAQGEHPAVAAAIRDHYKPVGQGDEVPTAPVTVAVSLADKLDTLVAFFLIQEKPTGSKDPFALRRAGIAIDRIIVEQGIRANLVHVLAIAMFDVIEQQIYSQRDAIAAQMAPVLQQITDPTIARLVLEDIWPKPEIPSDPDAPLPVQQRHREQAASFIEVIAFLLDRLKVQQREAGVRHDLIDAVFALGGEDDLVRLLARVRALQSFVTTEDGANLLAGYKRAANILKKEGWGAQSAPLPAREGSGVGDETHDRASKNQPTPSPSLPGRGGKKALSYTPEIEEAALIDALDSAAPAAADAVEREDFEAAMAALASLRAPIDAFFEKVTVNDPDPAKRTARLALLARVRDAVHGVADFSKIEG
ncbi:glycine--tRNA ligase subunit beta [Sphingomonas koreensis]|nr:glycine--tRNA ligase subunit beta [Sphingomonas koreensis]